MGILMLHILKIVGIILLAILLLLVLLFLLVLFVPIRYSLEGSYQTEFLAKGQISWLLHLLDIRGRYEKEVFYKVRILGIPFLTSEKKATSKPKRRTNKKRKETAETAGEVEVEKTAQRAETAQTTEIEKSKEIVLPELKDSVDQVQISVTEESREEEFEKQEPKDQETEDQEPKDQESEDQEIKDQEPKDQEFEKQGSEKQKSAIEDKKSSKKTASSTKKPKTSLRSKIRKIISRMQHKFKTLRTQIRKAWENISFYTELMQKEETIAAFELCKKKIFKIVRSILPRKLKINMVVGTGEVYYTAQILSLQGILYPLLGEKLSIVPDFDRKRIEGTFYLKGKITVAVLVWNAVVIVLNRNIRNLIKQIKGGTQNDRK